MNVTQKPIQEVLSCLHQTPSQRLVSLLRSQTGCQGSGYNLYKAERTATQHAALDEEKKKVIFTEASLCSGENEPSWKSEQQNRLHLHTSRILQHSGCSFERDVLNFWWHLAPVHFKFECTCTIFDPYRLEYKVCTQKKYTEDSWVQLWGLKLKIKAFIIKKKNYVNAAMSDRMRQFLLFKSTLQRIFMQSGGADIDGNKKPQKHT